eukprot:6203453-Pleurochrysis_carterae.AAC.1
MVDASPCKARASAQWQRLGQASTRYALQAPAQAPAQRLRSTVKRVVRTSAPADACTDTRARTLAFARAAAHALAQMPTRALSRTHSRTRAQLRTWLEAHGSDRRASDKGQKRVAGARTWLVARDVAEPLQSTPRITEHLGHVSSLHRRQVQLGVAAKQADMNRTDGASRQQHSFSSAKQLPFSNTAWGQPPSQTT